jgi:hypothetical protein
MRKREFAVNRKDCCTIILEVVSKTDIGILDVRKIKDWEKPAIGFHSKIQDTGGLTNYYRNSIF